MYTYLKNPSLLNYIGPQNYPSVDTIFFFLPKIISFDTIPNAKI